MRWVKITAILIGVFSILYKRYQEKKNNRNEHDEALAIEDFSDVDEAIESADLEQDEWIQIGKFNPFEAENVLRTLQRENVEFQIQRIELESRRKVRPFIIVGVCTKTVTTKNGQVIDNVAEFYLDQMEQLLFQDILHGHTARREHGLFTDAIKAFGATNLDFTGLLEAALAWDPETTCALRQRIAQREHLAPAIVERLEGMEPAQLADALVGGIPTEPERMSLEHFFDLFRQFLEMSWWPSHTRLDRPT